MKDDELEKEEDEELEKGSESDIVRSLLADESRGLGDLEQAIAGCQDPKLKEILEAIQEDEQKHNAALEQWMQENTAGGEEEHESEESPAEEEAEDDEAIEASADEEPDETPLPDDDEETEKEDDPKGDLIDDIREILAQHESETEKADEGPGDEEDDLEKDDANGEEDEGKPDFLKEDDEEAEKHCLKSYRVPIIKGDQQIVYGVVSEPDSIDLQGDRLSKSEIRKACHRFMIESQKIGKEHDGIAKADIIESYIAPMDFKCGGQVVKSGSWVMAVKIHDPDLWQAVKKGDITGFSIAGKGERTPF